MAPGYFAWKRPIRDRRAELHGEQEYTDVR